MTCTVPGCPFPLFGRTYCQGHYRKWKRFGTPLPRAKVLETKPECQRPGCEGRMWAPDKERVLGSLVTRVRECPVCGWRSLTVEVPLNLDSMESLGTEMLGSYLRRMQDDEESSGRTTSETPASWEDMTSTASGSTRWPA